MQNVLDGIYSLMPFFDLLMVIFMVVKIILMLGFRSFNIGYFITSYFRFYERSRIDEAHNRSRRWYVMLNNYINYYTYLWLFLCVLSYMAYGKIY